MVYCVRNLLLPPFSAPHCHLAAFAGCLLPRGTYTFGSPLVSSLQRVAFCHSLSAYRFAAYHASGTAFDPLLPLPCCLFAPSALFTCRTSLHAGTRSPHVLVRCFWRESGFAYVAGGSLLPFGLLPRYTTALAILSVYRPAHAALRACTRPFVHSPLAACLYALPRLLPRQDRCGLVTRCLPVAHASTPLLTPRSRVPRSADERSLPLDAARVRFVLYRGFAGASRFDAPRAHNASRSRNTLAFACAFDARAVSRCVCVGWRCARRSTLHTHFTHLHTLEAPLAVLRGAWVSRYAGRFAIAAVRLRFVLTTTHRDAHRARAYRKAAETRGIARALDSACRQMTGSDSYCDASTARCARAARASGRRLRALACWRCAGIARSSILFAFA